MSPAQPEPDAKIFARARVIINADDFGLARCVNRGIERAHREGLVTSTTLLANGPAFEDAVGRARALPGLGVGVHLNLVRGRPLSPRADIPDLIDADGFLAPRRLFRALRRADRAESPLRQAETEYAAQIRRVREAGLHPTHLDFEQHHGRRPALYALAVRLAREHGIGAIRSLREPCLWAWRRGGWPGTRAALRAAGLRLYADTVGRAAAAGATPFLQMRARPDAPVIRPDHFLGQSWIGALDAGVWRRLADGPAWPPGLWEIMLHPGEYDPVELDGLAREIGASWIHPRRPLELAAATAPDVRERWRNARDDGRLETVHFGDIGRRSPS